MWGRQPPNPVDDSKILTSHAAFQSRIDRQDLRREPMLANSTLLVSVLSQRQRLFLLSIPSGRATVHEHAKSIHMSSSRFLLKHPSRESKQIGGSLLLNCRGMTTQRVYPLTSPCSGIYVDRISAISASSPAPPSSRYSTSCKIQYTHWGYKRAY